MWLPGKFHYYCKIRWECRVELLSPDSEWLTYTRMGKNEINVVYVYNIAEKKEYPVTDKWYNSSSPVFSADGKYLIFSSARDFNPTYGSLEWNMYIIICMVCTSLCCLKIHRLLSCRKMRKWLHLMLHPKAGIRNRQIKGSG